MLWDSFLSPSVDRSALGGFQLQFLSKTSVNFAGVAGFSISSVKWWGSLRSLRYPVTATIGVFELGFLLERIILATSSPLI